MLLWLPYNTWRYSAPVRSDKTLRYSLKLGSGCSLQCYAWSQCCAVTINAVPILYLTLLADTCFEWSATVLCAVFTGSTTVFLLPVYYIPGDKENFHFTVLSVCR